jgi:hypothetical protein
MKLARPAALLLLALSAGISVWFVSVLKPTSVGAFIFFAGWLLAPYGFLCVTLLLRPTGNPAPTRWLFIAAVVSVGGILMLADLIFWHKDAQGAIGVLLVPLLQSVAAAVLLVIFNWATRAGRYRSDRVR